MDEFTRANWTAILSGADRFLAFWFDAVSQLAQNHTSLKLDQELYQ